MNKKILIVLGIFLKLTMAEAADPGNGNSPRLTINSRDVSVPFIPKDAVATPGFLNGKELQAVYFDGSTNLNLVNLSDGKEICSTYLPLRPQVGVKPTISAPRTVYGQVSVLVQIPTVIDNGASRSNSYYLELCTERHVKLGDSLGIRDVSKVLSGKNVFINRWMSPGPSHYSADFLLLDLENYQITTELPGMQATYPEAYINSKGDLTLLLLGSNPLMLWNATMENTLDLVPHDAGWNWFPEHSALVPGHDSLVLKGEHGGLSFLDVPSLVDGKKEILAFVPSVDLFPFETPQGIFQQSETEIGTLILQVRLEDKMFVPVGPYYNFHEENCSATRTIFRLPNQHLGTSLFCEYPDGTFAPPQAIKIWDLEAEVEVSSHDIPHFFGFLKGHVLQSKEGKPYLIFEGSDLVAYVMDLATLELQTLPQYASVNNNSLGLIKGADSSGILFEKHAYSPQGHLEKSELCVGPDWLSVGQTECVDLIGTRNLGYRWPLIRKTDGSTVLALPTEHGFRVVTVQ